MASAWMIRAGERGSIFSDFEERSIVAIGWYEVGDLSDVSSANEIRDRYFLQFPAVKAGKANSDMAVVTKFRFKVKVDDDVVTYDPGTRIYLLGKIAGEYQFEPDLVSAEFPHVRKVIWSHRVSRDALSASTKNSLGSTLTLFSVKPNMLQELRGGGTREAPEAVRAEEQLDIEQAREDIQGRSRELLKDRILLLSHDQLEQLAAALLRAMGYRTRITPKGSDRRLDVFASKDGLGLEFPRIKVEVKHKSKPIGAEDVRSFVATLREGDRGIYISTGGFTRDSLYEGERAERPIYLMNLDALAEYITVYYEDFDREGRSLVPLVRLYWPVD